MKIKEKVQDFLNEYNNKLQLMNTKLEEATTRIDELQIEISYIHLKDLPEAIERRVLENDATYENKLRKIVDKLQNELVSRQEEVLVLENARHRFKVEYADKITALELLYREEMKLVEKRQMALMMNAKRDYVIAILKEAEAIREYASINTRIQEVQYNGGRRTSVTSDFELKNAPIKEHLHYHDNVMLQLDLNTVKRLVKGTYSEADVKYLDTFKHRKDL
jgi:hypothetical protein